MAKLKSVIVSRYRSFKERTRLNITPLVIMIGKNGSGKSVISRLLIILSDSLHNGQLNQPINLIAGGVRHASEFADLAYMKSSLPFEIGAEMEVEEHLYELSVTIRYVKEREALVLERFKLTKDSNETLEIALADEAQMEKQNPAYAGRMQGSSDSTYVPGFLGFCPILTGTILESWAEVISNIKKAVPVVSYLGPFRTEVGSFIGSARPDISSLGPKGENTIEILVDDIVRNGGTVCNAVSQWFKDELSHAITVERSSEYSKIVLQPIGRELAITLSETGAGFSQVLPIVVQNTLAQSTCDKEHALIAEQPELHLHPAMHGAVADLYISTMKSASGFILIETHSEQFIMRARRRIAEGLAADLVSIWSIGHCGSGSESESIAHITFDNEGNPSDWPEGVFEESFVELGKLRAAVRTGKT